MKAGQVKMGPETEASGLFSRAARQQYAALAWLQYRVFVNSLRYRRGSFELGARLLSGVLFFVIAFGPAVGMGTGAYIFASGGQTRGLAALLWVMCLVWQGFSALAPALAGQNPELSHLLRYPVRFGSWVLLTLMYGIAAPSTLIGCLWAIAVAIGVSVAHPPETPGIVFTMAVFALFNLLLSRTILAWIERLLAQRRTREIVTGVFLMLALAAQALNPAFHAEGTGVARGVARAANSGWLHEVWRVQKELPPGLAWQSMMGFTQGNAAAAGEAIGLLGLYCLLTGGLLGIRLRAESRGENFSEAPRRPDPPARALPRVRRVPGLSGPVAAIVEKDLRYLLRSGPMLYNLAAPLVMVFLFSGISHGSYRRMEGVRAQFAFPMAMVWALLGLSRFVSNTFGTEAEGIQFYFLAPTRLRTVVAAKNLFHGLLILLEAGAISVLTFVRFGPPAPAVAAATVGWLFFALPTSFAVGNILSIRMPYRLNMTRMRRQDGSVGNTLLSMLTQMGMIGVGAAVLLPCAAFGHLWLASPVLLLLGAGAIACWLVVLSRVEGMIEARRESLAQTLVRPTAAG